MFIVFESVASNDTRLIPQLQRFHTYWNYTVYQIDDSLISALDPSLNFSILTAEEGRASMLSDAIENKVQIKPNTNTENIILDNPSGKPLEEKVYYTLTDADHIHVVSFVKKVLHNFGENHIKTQDLLSLFKQEIDSLSTLEDCNWFMYNYLDVAHWNTHGEKIRKFEITW